MIPWQLDGYEVVFTTRLGGVSEGPYASLNLGRKSGDEVERVDENRRIACEAIGADVARLALNFQVHSARVREAEPATRGERADGLWTDEAGLPILAMSADCLPIAIARTEGSRPAVAVLHAGWRGLLEGIVASGVEALGRGGLAAAIGPGIGSCCYEVGKEVAAPFRERFGDDVVRESRLDLWTSAERALRAAGVERVDRFDRCTACEPETFFSHRRDRGRTGRQGVIACVTG
ncbi:MAG: polyphenol oxidase family protein [Gaiellaceae bacterium]